MELNQLPPVDVRPLEPGCCCPKFDPALWDNLDLHFRDKPFVRAATVGIFHIPLNIRAVFTRTLNAIKAAGAGTSQFAILSDDSSLWRGEHYFAVSREVPGLSNVTLTGDYLTRVFTGPYSDAYIWVGEMREMVETAGYKMGKLYFFYTNCPKCAEKRGRNHVVGIAELIVVRK
jgi:hypothetical protein